MAYDNNNGTARYSTPSKQDRFGNPTMLKKGWTVVDKKSGSVLPISACYAEFGGKLVKIEVSQCHKSPDKNGNPAFWFKFTLKQKQAQNRQISRF